jgi:hypothetical protein
MKNSFPITSNVGCSHLFMEKQQTWICDTCGEPITSVRDGWVEWLSNRTRGGKGLRLVHHQPASPRGSCQYDSRGDAYGQGFTLNDLSLDQFLGPDGLTLLLSMLAEGELPKEEVLEMTKRLHIPGYEHARRHFARAISEGAFEPNMPESYYWQSDIRATLDFMAREQRRA